MYIARRLHRKKPCFVTTEVDKDLIVDIKAEGEDILLLVKNYNGHKRNIGYEVSGKRIL